MTVEHKWIISFDEMPQDVIYEIIDEAKKQGLHVNVSTRNVCIIEEKFVDLRGIK